ncbi:hypothetical protein ACIGCP_16470 [Cellulophaga baltica]|uniref:hypothetical protein n=1 Tax=Cellulophaga baltica TaxID=76594 RepID=UPI0037C5004C
MEELIFCSVFSVLIVPDKNSSIFLQESIVSDFVSCSIDWNYSSAKNFEEDHTAVY